MGLLEILLILVVLSLFTGGIYVGNSILHILAIVLVVVLVLRLINGRKVP